MPNQEDEVKTCIRCGTTSRCNTIYETYCDFVLDRKYSYVCRGCLMQNYGRYNAILRQC